MRLLIYQFINPTTSEIIETTTLDKANEIRKREFPYEGFTVEKTVLREFAQKLLYLGKDENDKRQYRYETIEEATTRVMAVN